MNKRTMRNCFFSGILAFSAVLSGSVLPVCAAGDVYEGAYNIHNAIAYADEYTDFDGDHNPLYEFYSQDCTNFVSQCISDGGGLQREEDFKPGISRFSNYHPWTVTPDLYDYLTRIKGYDTGSFTGGYTVDQATNSLSVWTSGEADISAGDLVFFDFGSNGSIDHAAVITGYDSNGVLCYAGHSNNRWMYPLGYSILDHGYDVNTSCTYHIVHMTDTSGLADVTSRYTDDMIVAIRSVETGEYVSCNTSENVDHINASANNTFASTWEYFRIVKNQYGEVGFRALGNGNFLSTRVDIDAAAAPVRAAYGQDYTLPEAWESFRIFEKDGVQYIQSQANGKWLQVSADREIHTLKACAKAASTWERFVIEITDSSFTGMAAPVVDGPSAEIKDTYKQSESTVSVVSQAYGTGYNEGVYTGDWRGGMPNGWGRLDYIDYNKDEKFYKFLYGGEIFHALYYEGNFSDGARYGSGVVVYEDGWKEEGTFYGAWEAGKKVFEGKVWYKDGSLYLEGYLTATSSTEAEWTWYTDQWQKVE